MPKKILVVIQSSVSVSLITGTVILYKQIQYAKDRHVGYTRANLKSLFADRPAIHDHFTAVKEDRMKTGAIRDIAASENSPTGIWNTISGFSWPVKDPNLSTDFGIVSTSHNYGQPI